jgi:hypothetical protein
MGGFTFKADTSNAALGRTHPDAPHLAYMSMLVGESGSFSGYVPHGVPALIEASPELLALARQYASECAECDGAGLVTITTYPGGIEVDNDDQPCPACTDIRAVIAKATHVPADESVQS